MERPCSFGKEPSQSKGTPRFSHKRNLGVNARGRVQGQRTELGVCTSLRGWSHGPPRPRLSLPLCLFPRCFGEAARAAWGSHPSQQARPTSYMDIRKIPLKLF